MVTLNQKQEIITRYLQGYSNRSTSRLLGLNRKTVDKVVKQYREAQEEIALTENIDGELLRFLTEQMTQAPQYPLRKSPARKWNEEMDNFLDEILVSEEQKKHLLRTSKQ